MHGRPNCTRVIRLRLLPDENVVWATRKGFFSLYIIFALFAIVGGFVIAVFGFGGGTSNGQSFPPNPTLGWVGITLALVGVAYVIISSLIAKSTKYILTNRRIMEIKFRKIIKEISLASFMGKPLSQFLDKEAAGTVNNQPIYNIRITDPKSVDFMELSSLNQRAVEELERICERARQVVRCRYCNTNNSASSSRCSHCSAPLQ
jgi:hypothetical protein